MAEEIIERITKQRERAIADARRYMREAEMARINETSQRELRDAAEGKAAALEQERDALRAELARERVCAPQLRALWAALEPHLQHCARSGDFLVIDVPNDEPIVSAGYELGDTWGTSDIILCDAGLLAQLIDALENLTPDISSVDTSEAQS